MLVILDAGQLLRHKYGGFYRVVSYAGNDNNQIILKHVWPFEQANQTRPCKDLLKFTECTEQLLERAMEKYTVEEYQTIIAEHKQSGTSMH